MSTDCEGPFKNKWTDVTREWNEQSGVIVIVNGLFVGELSSLLGVNVPRRLGGFLMITKIALF